LIWFKYDQLQPFCMDYLEEMIAAARGEVEVDLFLTGGNIANLLSGEVHRADVAIHKGRIAGFDCCSARNTIDLKGLILAPGFIDGHVHIESSMVTVPEYARAVVSRGTTTVIADPHEIANVWGEAGVRYILESSRGVPLNVFVMLPTCVPATNLETAGAVLDADALAGLMEEDGVLGLAEVMNYPGVIRRDPEVMKKIRLADGRRIDGHAPGLTGRDLSAYINAGISSDHECTTLAEAEEKLRQGMYIMLREGSAAKNLLDLLPLVTPQNSRQFLFVSDDRHPADILGEGNIDFMVRLAIEQGLDPITALQISSLNAAQYFGLRDLGAIAPGYRADIAVLDGLDSLNVVKVIKDGKLVAEDGEFISPQKFARFAKARQKSMHTGKIDLQSFGIEAEAAGPARVIGIIPNQIITKTLLLSPRVVEGKVVSDTDCDILKMAVVERHKATGNVGLGLVQGFGLACGALASSVAHDSHNIVVVGVSDEEMLAAVLAVKQMGGGLVAVAEGKILASLPLPVAGLLSERRMQDVAEDIAGCIDAAHRLGCGLGDPFMTLSFLCLPVIPELKLTDMGLVDVNAFRLVPMFLEKC
jgi:adenine deaminase